MAFECMATYQNLVPLYNDILLFHSYLKDLTVCPGSSAPPEKISNIFASENEVYTIY